MGSLPYSTWSDFVQEFINKFCPKNKILIAHPSLQTSWYYQGSKTIDKHIDNFQEMIRWAHYLEGSHIVLKFHQILNPKIQDYITCLMNGHPSDESPCEWYAASILCDENCIANEGL